ncbi:MAG: hydrogenase maturation peptidase HycI [Candidatus Omnitrophica bacterium]|nr:hydrogenase maturation peptidase HycI [Candidatus Omnitrophota bacterium]
MLKIKKALKSNLLQAKKICVLGIGSELRGDDAGGMLAAEYLKVACRSVKTKVPLRIVFGSTAPENFTGLIRKFNPTHLVIIDSTDLEKKPGSIAVIDEQEIGGISFSTHRLPLKVLIDYLVKALGCKVIVIGIQPKTLEFGAKPSKEVEKKAHLLCNAITEIITGNFKKRVR